MPAVLYNSEKSCYLDVIIQQMSMNRFNTGVMRSLPAWLYSSAPGSPAGTHGHCDTVAEARSSAERDNNSEHEHTSCRPQSGP